MRGRSYDRKLGVLTLAAALAWGAAGAASAKGKSPAFVGRWRLVAGERGGKRRPVPKRLMMLLEFGKDGSFSSFNSMAPDKQHGQGQVLHERGHWKMNKGQLVVVARRAGSRKAVTKRFSVLTDGKKLLLRSQMPGPKGKPVSVVLIAVRDSPTAKKHESKSSAAKK